MADARIDWTCRDGTVVHWQDGIPPLVAVSAQAAIANGVSSEGLGLASTQSPPVKCLHAFVDLDDSTATPTPVDCLVKHIAHNNANVLSLTLRIPDLLSASAVWHDWLWRLFEKLNRMGARVLSRTELEPRSLESDSLAIERLASFGSKVEVRVHDYGLAADSSLRLMDTAASLADAGVKLRISLCLSEANSLRWAEHARAWIVAARVAEIDFDRPILPAQLSMVRNVAPSPSVVTDFLMSAMKSHAYDLWRSEPFSTLLRRLTSGNSWIPDCHNTVWCIGAKTYKCRFGLEACGGDSTACKCQWPRFCDAVSTQCSVLRRRMSSDAWRSWDRLFCHAIQQIMPELLEECAVGANYHRYLMANQAEVRLRIAARDGKPVIWKDSVITDHRPRRGENADGTRNHLDIAQLDGPHAPGSSVGATANP